MAGVFVVYIPTKEYQESKLNGELTENGDGIIVSSRRPSTMDNPRKPSTSVPPPPLGNSLCVSTDDLLDSSPGINPKRGQSARSPKHSPAPQPRSPRSKSARVKLTALDLKAVDSIGSTVSVDSRASEGRVGDSSNHHTIIKFVSLEKLLEDTLTDLRIIKPVWQPTRDGKFYQVVFTSETQQRCEQILKTLSSIGIGTLHESTLSVVPCSIYYHGEEKSNSETKETAEEFESVSEQPLDEDHPLSRDDSKSLRKQFLKSIKARLTVAQVVEGVKSGALVTFDYVMFTILASLIAALGLVENSPVIVVASMLISPIMGPIMAWTFGIVIQDKSLQRMGMKGELIGLIACISCGIAFGLTCGPLAEVWGQGTWPTGEMVARGQWRTLWVGMLIALPSGAGVALSVLGGNAGSLVGVAISASLLPPCVNGGILFGRAAVISIRSIGEDTITMLYEDIEITGRPSLLPHANYHVAYSTNMCAENVILGLISIALALLNIICIVFMAIVVLKIKEVAPYTSLSQTRRFWKEDIKIARDYNKTVQGQESYNLGHSFVQEWAALNSIDPETVTKTTALKEIVEEAEDDDVYRTVMKHIGPQSPIDPVSRQLNRRTWPHPQYTFRNSKKTKVWDIDFTPMSPRSTSLKKRFFGGGSQSTAERDGVFDNNLKHSPLLTNLSQLDTIVEHEGRKPVQQLAPLINNNNGAAAEETGSISPHSPRLLGSGSEGSTTGGGGGMSSYVPHATRMFRNFIGRHRPSRFVVTRADEPKSRASKKDKRNSNHEDDGIV